MKACKDGGDGALRTVTGAKKEFRGEVVWRAQNGFA